MRIPFTLSIAALAATTLAAQKDGPILLTEQKTGIAVTLPKDWQFATKKNTLVAANEAGTALVVLAETTQDFTKPKPDVSGSLEKSSLKDVEVDVVAVVAEDERGAIEALVQVSGSGTDEGGERVEFSALISKCGPTAGLALGAWKDAAAKQAIAGILDSLVVQQPKAAAKGGLQLQETRTGAAIHIPEGWATMASRKGLLAVSKERDAMTMIIRPQENFDLAVKNARRFLEERVFEKVEMSAFDEVEATEASSGRDVEKLVAATGKAVDRADKKPVEFRVLAAKGKTDADRAVILGVWKNETAKASIEEMLASIRFAKREKPAKTEKPEIEEEVEEEKEK